MTATQIRNRLKEYIDSAEDKKLKAIYTLVADDFSDKFELSVEQKKILDSRMADYEAGIGETYTWDETVAIAQKALALRRK